MKEKEKKYPYVGEIIFSNIKPEINKKVWGLIITPSIVNRTFGEHIFEGSSSKVLEVKQVAHNMWLVKTELGFGQTMVYVTEIEYTKESLEF